MKNYTVSMGKSVKMTTTATLIIFSIILSLNGWLASGNSFGKNLYTILLSLLIVSVLIISYLYSIKGYTIDHINLQIVRPLNLLTIPRTEIINVRKMKEEEMKNLRRRYGIGGLFSYTGIFQSDLLGELRLYITRKDNCVLVETRTMGNFVFSPDDATFLSDLWQ